MDKPTVQGIFHRFYPAYLDQYSPSPVQARGAAPCCGKAAISPRRESSLCGDKPSAERTRPQGCISAPYPSSGIGRIIRDIQLSEENLKKYRYERLSEIFPRIM